MEKKDDKASGALWRLVQLGQTIVIGCVLPWGVWVTGQIYGLTATCAQFEQWKASREKAAVATMTDVELAKLKVKDEITAAMTTKLDAIITKLNDVDVKLTRHEAASGTVKP